MLNKKYRSLRMLKKPANVMAKLVPKPIDNDVQ